MCDHMNFIRDNLHSTFYASLCCSRRQDSLQRTDIILDKTSFLLHVLHTSNRHIFSLKMTHKETKYVADIMFQVLKILDLTDCAIVGYMR